MNDNAEIPSPARPEGESAATEPASPARRARGRRAAGAVDVEVASNDPASSASIERSDAEPAPKPRRRRAAAAAEVPEVGALTVSEELANGNQPRADEAAAPVAKEPARTASSIEDDRPRETAPLNAPPVVPEPDGSFHSKARAALQSESDAGSPAPTAAESVGAGVVNAAGADAGDLPAGAGSTREGEPAFGERGRRRNRRDRHRNRDRAAFVQ